jgi:hypothetical protein
MGLTSGAHVSAREEKQGAKAKSTNPKGKHIRENMPTVHGPNGSVEEAVGCEMDGPTQGNWASWAGFHEKIPTEIDFQIPMNFIIWQDFGDFYKEI